MSLPARDYSVLVVDDEELIRLHLIDALEDAELTAHGAADAAGAIAHLDAAPDIGVAVLDVDLTGDMDGLQLAHLIRRRWPHIGIVMSSGLVRILGRDLPSKSIFLAKPYALDDAVRAVEATRAAASKGSPEL